MNTQEKITNILKNYYKNQKIYKTNIKNIIINDMDLNKDVNDDKIALHSFCYFLIKDESNKQKAIDYAIKNNMLISLYKNYSFEEEWFYTITFHIGEVNVNVNFYLTESEIPDKLKNYSGLSVSNKEI
jgi:hypothetical protein